jgi:2-polyprenyl-3-methyl-5-hydroxy-6-metoxy-1,4-benzoquinol methylase
MSRYTCKICGNSINNKTFIAKEMMYGLRDEFEYLECGQCGCLQILEIPKNIERYYPDDYYSYSQADENSIVHRSLFASAKRLLKRNILNAYLNNTAKVPRSLVQKIHRNYPWIKQNTINTDARILDIGCGSGQLLLVMCNDGFRHLKGVDPFIKEQIDYRCGVTVFKKQIHELSGSFDFIMLHHAFEHMDKPLEVLQQIYNLLNPGGYVLIRIPIADSYAWEEYGVNWVQLDAPRHFYLHTNKSMQLLSGQAGFVLKDVIYDSWKLQFFGSEKYIRDIPFVDDSMTFSNEQMTQYKLRSIQLNEEKRGDSACFYLYKP